LGGKEVGEGKRLGGKRLGGKEVGEERGWGGKRLGGKEVGREKYVCTRKMGGEKHVPTNAHLKTTCTNPCLLLTDFRAIVSNVFHS
jgi:hypothetical protein